MTGLLSSTERILMLTLSTMGKNAFITLQFLREKDRKASEASTDYPRDHRCPSDRRATVNHAWQVGRDEEEKKRRYRYMKREQIIQWLIAVITVVLIFLIVTRDRDAHAMSLIEFSTSIASSIFC